MSDKPQINLTRRFIKAKLRCVWLLLVQHRVLDTCELTCILCGCRQLSKEHVMLVSEAALCHQISMDCVMCV